MPESTTLKNKLRRREMLSFSRPTMGNEEVREIVHSIKSGWITTGPKCHQFEEDVRDAAEAVKRIVEENKR